MAITILPTKIDGTTENGGIGRPKSDNLPPDVTITDAELEHYTTAVELENMKTALVEVCEAVGDGDDPDPTSLTARVEAIEASELVSGVLTPTALSGNVDNYAPTGHADADVWRLDPNGATRTITGIASVAAGRVLRIVNLSAANTIEFSHDVTSTAANRFYLPAEADLALPPHGIATFWYDGTSARWRMISGLV